MDEKHIYSTVPHKLAKIFVHHAKRNNFPTLYENRAILWLLWMLIPVFAVRYSPMWVTLSTCLYDLRVNTSKGPIHGVKVQVGFKFTAKVYNASARAPTRQCVRGAWRRERVFPYMYNIAAAWFFAFSFPI